MEGGLAKERQAILHRHGAPIGRIKKQVRPIQTRNKLFQTADDLVTNHPISPGTS
jgi:hypothetical protein